MDRFKVTKKLIDTLNSAHDMLPEGYSLSKGGIGEIALAYYLDHSLVYGDKGADAIDSEGLLYEYKISEKGTAAFAFHCGARREHIAGWNMEDHIRNKFSKIEGAYLAVRDGMDIIDIEYLSRDTVINLCLDFMSTSISQQINPNWKLDSLRRKLEL